MNQLTIFNNDEFGQVRTLTIENEPWFVGKDVASILGYANTKDAIGTHIDDEDKTILQRSEITTFEIPNRGLTVINESGLYSLILSSKLPSAKKFKRWVTSEVLPSIRKTGGYGVNGQLTDKQRIKVGEVISKSYRHSLPYVLDVYSPFLSQEVAKSNKYKDVVKHNILINDNTVSMFLDDYDVLGLPTNQAYSNYMDFCESNQLIGVSHISFSKEVKRLLKVVIVDKKINGKKRRVFISR